MNGVKFEGLLKELDNNSVETLIAKNAKYSSSDDRLHNFNAGADISGQTPAQTCWGYLSKHLVALRDMVDRNDFSDREDFLEKCQDSINYIRFLWLIGNETAKSDYPSLKSARFDAEVHAWFCTASDGTEWICKNGKDWEVVDNEEKENEK